MDIPYKEISASISRKNPENLGKFPHGKKLTFKLSFIKHSVVLFW